MRYPQPQGTATLKIENDQEQNITIYYFITKDDCMTEGAPQADVYGIEAEINVEGRIIDSSAVKDISPSLSEVKEVVNLLILHQVTPITLKDVIEDYIAEK